MVCVCVADRVSLTCEKKQFTRQGSLARFAEDYPRILNWTSIDLAAVCEIASYLYCALTSVKRAMPSKLQIQVIS